MDSRIVSTLRCPERRTPLGLKIIESEVAGERTLVKTGILYSEESRRWYPIIHYVPMMLRFSTPIVEKFAREFVLDLKELYGYAAPADPPMPGERRVQATFTEEWEGLGDAPLVFGYTREELLALHSSYLHLEDQTDFHPGRVLNVGCGFGREAEVLCEILPEAEVFGIDLNLSLLKAAPGFRDHPRLHLIVSSLFHLPFEPESFDHVHSHGVIHHTFSTRKAFKAIEQFCRPRGSLFIWVYAKEDALMLAGWQGRIRRAMMLFNNNVTRQILSRLPSAIRSGAIYFMAALTHPFFLLRRAGSGWTFQNTQHVLRDGFTPPYIHFHGFNEVIHWFENLGFRPRVHSPKRYFDLMGRPVRGIGVLGIRQGRSGRP